MRCFLPTCPHLLAYDSGWGKDFNPPKNKKKNKKKKHIIEMSIMKNIQVMKISTSV